MVQSNTIECDECGGGGELKNGYGSQHAVECPDCGAEWTVEAVPTQTMNFNEIDQAAKEEIRDSLESVAEDFDEYAVGEVVLDGSILRVELNNHSKPEQVTVEIDRNP